MNNYIKIEAIFTKKEYDEIMEDYNNLVLAMSNKSLKFTKECIDFNKINTDIEQWNDYDDDNWNEDDDWEELVDDPSDWENQYNDDDDYDDNWNEDDDWDDIEDDKFIKKY